MKDMPWDHGLEVTAAGEGLVGHAGGVILREMADRSGLTAALKDALAREGRFPEVDRGVAMVSAAVMIALGGRSMSGIAVLEHLSLVLGEPVTWRRCGGRWTWPIRSRWGRSRRPGRGYARMSGS